MSNRVFSLFLDWKLLCFKPVSFHSNFFRNIKYDFSLYNWCRLWDQSLIEIWARRTGLKYGWSKQRTFRQDPCPNEQGWIKPGQGTTIRSPCLFRHFSSPMWRFYHARNSRDTRPLTCTRSYEDLGAFEIGCGAHWRWRCHSLLTGKTHTCTRTYYTG